jgi:transcriptional regulator with XRE-family HTH domain
MKDNNFAFRLNMALDREGFPPKNRGRIQLLAEMVGLTHRGASKWVNGESSPPAKKIKSLAKKLNVSEKWLEKGEGSMCEAENSAYKSQDLAFDINIYDPSSFLSKKPVIVDSMTCNLPPLQGNLFGLILDTEAMSPRFPKGSVIIFVEARPKDGDFVLINFPGFPHPLFRQLLIIGNNLYLYAHNPKFDRLMLTDSNKIIGKLVQAILYFE